jgi:hypothetical protein
VVTAGAMFNGMSMDFIRSCASLSSRSCRCEERGHSLNPCAPPRTLIYVDEESSKWI